MAVDHGTEPNLHLPGLRGFYDRVIPLSWPIVRFGVGWVLLVHGYGKVLRGSFDRMRGTVRLLAALDHQTGCVIRQRAIPPETNEEKTCLEFLKDLVLDGRIVVLDAAFCYPEICDAVVEGKGHYIVPVKENQPTLLNAISSEFSAADAAFSPLRPAGTRC